MTSITLRRATSEDSDALLRLHRAALGWAIEEIYGPWDDEVQARFHERWFDAGRAWVIEYDGGLAGLLDYAFDEGRLSVNRIEIDPPYQNQGIGTAVLRDLLEQADRRGVPTVLQVFDINPALRLYERLGFRESARDGHKVHMIRHPSPPGGCDLR